MAMTSRSSARSSHSSETGPPARAEDEVDEHLAVPDLVQPVLGRRVGLHARAGECIPRALGVLRLDEEVDVVVGLGAPARPRREPAAECERNALVPEDGCHPLQRGDEAGHRPFGGHGRRCALATSELIASTRVSITSLRAILVLLGVVLLMLPEAAAGATSAHFRSPSGNINCRMERAFVDCLVHAETWSRHAKRPLRCDVDWFPAELSLSARRVTVGSCRGDVGPECLRDLPCRVLGYGRSITVGRFRCASARTGVTCRRTDGRRVGFRIAREGYRIFR